ncbi:TPA: ABC-F family ATP-binding cassette domain-containing protein, partial [Staphylococcus aureus]|nr:ABC-F family ATP-binding cassette domain-containing protein [Staphylococcus aureus]
RDNVLILDEPTNHLDIDSKEMLEQALQHFEGTILFVSHDRYFINQLANKVFDLTIDGGKMYLGDYQYYIEKVEEAEALKAHQEEQSVNVQAHKKSMEQSSYHNQKEQRREQRKLERQISECENEIETLETTILQIDEQLTQPEVYNNPQKANELAIQKQDSEQKLEHAMSKWEELQQKL